MTNEQKKLLLKDICCRLPYGVKFESENAERVYFIDTSDDEIYINGTNIENVKPYLFPMSSMTKEQIKEFNSITLRCNTYTGKATLLTDFCNKNHIDYRGLIPMGLVIDATGKNIY